MTRGGFDTATGAFLRAKPFRPFLVEVASGDRVLIDHPEVFNIHGDIVVIPGNGTDPRIIGIDQVTQLLYPPPRPGS